MYLDKYQLGNSQNVLLCKTYINVTILYLINYNIITCFIENNHTYNNFERVSQCYHNIRI